MINIGPYIYEMKEYENTGTRLECSHEKYSKSVTVYTDKEVKALYHEVIRLRRTISELEMTIDDLLSDEEQ